MKVSEMKVNEMKVNEMKARKRTRSRIVRWSSRWTAPVAALGLALATAGEGGAMGSSPEGAVLVPSAASAMQEEDPEALYRAGREALNRGDHQEAAELFARVAAGHPGWERAGESLYWAAFSLYRLGELEAALQALERQEAEHPGAARLGDSRALTIRIRGELARRGDVASAERMAEVAVLVPVLVPQVQALAAQLQAEALAGQGERLAELAQLQAGTLAGQGERLAEVAQLQAGALVPALVPQMQALAAQLQAEALVGPGQVAWLQAGALARVPTQEGCPEDEDGLMAAALNALMMMDADRALPVLERVLARRDECSVPLRRQATFLVAQKGADRAEELLLDVVRNDPSLPVRSQAVFWLSQAKSERAVDLLVEIVRTSPEPELQGRALFALSQKRNDRAAEALRDYVLDESKPERLRGQAAAWLVQHGTYAELSALRELYERVESPALKRQVFFGISQRRDAESVEWLLQRAMDEDEPRDVRRQAVFWAAQGGADLPRLKGLYARLDDREIKEYLIFAAGQRKGPEAVDWLMELARSEEDSGIRKKAILWLGQSGDPRAAEFLLELIERP